MFALSDTGLAYDSDHEFPAYAVCLPRPALPSSGAGSVPLSGGACSCASRDAEAGKERVEAESEPVFLDVEPAD